MDNNLNEMSGDELKEHKKSLQKQLRSVERALDTLKDRQKKKALEAAEKAAAEMGFSLADLTGAARGKKPASKSPAKYRNPEDPAQTWSGRGRRPDWIRAAMEKGGDLSKFEI